MPWQRNGESEAWLISRWTRLGLYWSWLALYQDPAGGVLGPAKGVSCLYGSMPICLYAHMRIAA